MFNTSGGGNTATGYQALNNNTTGTRNTAIGWRSGFARRRNIDMIVVGTRGLSKVKASSMGSVSRKLLDLTETNCLVIR